MEKQVEPTAPIAETNEQFIGRREAAISKWLDRRNALEAIKPQEREARDEVSAILFPNPKKGTNRYHLNGGYAIKLVHGTNYTLGDKDAVRDLGNGEQEKVTIEEQVRFILHEIEKLGNRGKIVALELVKWKPELNEKAYLALDVNDPTDAQAKATIDKIITTKPATPQLTFEEPKEK